MTPRLNIPAALSRQGARAPRAAAMTGTHVEILGEIAVPDIGETTYPLNFPYEFIEAPLVIGSGRLVDNILVQGQYPTWSVGFRSLTPKVLTSGVIHYVGGELVIVVSGRLGQPSIVTYRIIGKALKNPVQPGLDTPI